MTNRGDMWIAGGLGSFGLSIGIITGLSQAEGISTELLTGCFTFIGGAVLSWAGFAKGPALSSLLRHDRGQTDKESDLQKDAPSTGGASSHVDTADQDRDSPQPDVARVGKSLMAFSLCLTLGLFLGIVVRVKSEDWGWLQPRSQPSGALEAEAEAEAEEAPIQADRSVPADSETRTTTTTTTTTATPRPAPDEQNTAEEPPTPDSAAQIARPVRATSPSRRPAPSPQNRKIALHNLTPEDCNELIRDVRTKYDNAAPDDFARYVEADLKRLLPDEGKLPTNDAFAALKEAAKLCSSP